MSAADAWFDGGERVGYDPTTRAIVRSGDAPLHVFLRSEGASAHAVTFLPGYPDGSVGWAKVHAHLPRELPKVFVEYVGMGDSDKPQDHAYSTAERTDLVEAVWRDLGVASTTLVAFDFSSLVVLEHLRRRLEDQDHAGPAIRGVLLFNGGLFPDGHTHPWYTTPVLRRLPKRARGGLGTSVRLFRLVAGCMWSKGYRVTDDELRDLLGVMHRRDGMFYLAAAAGFVADHEAQGERLDFGALYRAYAGQFPILVAGSDEDRFEHRQVDLAEERLGLRVERLPGGHLTTSEQPEALAALIAKFARTAGYRFEPSGSTKDASGAVVLPTS